MDRRWNRIGKSSREENMWGKKHREGQIKLRSIWRVIGKPNMVEASYNMCIHESNLYEIRNNTRKRAPTGLLLLPKKASGTGNGLHLLKLGKGVPQTTQSTAKAICGLPQTDSIVLLLKTNLAHFLTWKIQGSAYLEPHGTGGILHATKGKKKKKKNKQRNKKQKQNTKTKSSKHQLNYKIFVYRNEMIAKYSGAIGA